MPTAFSQVSEVKSNRQVQSLLLRSVNPDWGRRDFCKFALCKSWVTVNEWDKRLAFCLDDYLADPKTGEFLWAPRQPWNHHQQWVLKKVKAWMNKAPKPTYPDLEDHIASHQQLYDHDQFFKELEEFYETKRTVENTKYANS